MRKAILILALGALPLLSGACASSGAKAEKVDRITLVEEHLSRLAAEIVELRQQGNMAAEQLRELQQEILSRLDMIRGDSARLDVKIDGVENRLQSISERVGDSELRLSNIRKELNGLRYSRFGSAYPRAQEGAGEADTASTPPGEEAGGALPGGSLAPGGEAEAFETAYADFLRGEYSLALIGFRNFLQRFPTAEKADDAQFHLAECLYSLGDYEAAVEEFDTLTKHYTESQFRVSATYKKALSFLESNQTAQGVILLQQLIRLYPEANEARLARQKLRSLGLNP